MQTTKRGRCDYRTAPSTDELAALTSFSYKDGEYEGALRVTFSKTHADDPKRCAAWNATVHRNLNGKGVTFTVYAGTDKTLPGRFAVTLSKIKSRVAR